MRLISEVWRYILFHKKLVSVHHNLPSISNLVSSSYSGICGSSLGSSAGGYKEILTLSTQKINCIHKCVICIHIHFRSSFSFLPSCHCNTMGLLPDTQNRGLRMRRKCRECFPHHRLQRKPLVSDPGIHHGTCIMHVPWCMSGSLNCGDGGKRSRHSRRMRNSQFYISGKRRMGQCVYYSFRPRLHKKTLVQTRDQ